VFEGGIMIKWLKNLFYIVKNYSYDQKRTIELLRVQREKMVALDKLIKERTNISADIGYLKGANYVILVGHYKNRDYINVFDLNGKTFAEIVEQFRAMTKHGNVLRVDAPAPFKAVLERDGFL
jgi:hypothetical protein